MGYTLSLSRRSIPTSPARSLKPNWLETDPELKPIAFIGQMGLQAELKGATLVSKRSVIPGKPTGWSWEQEQAEDPGPKDPGERKRRRAGQFVQPAGNLELWMLDSNGSREP
jgi:hypothetical protein